MSVRRLHLRAEVGLHNITVIAGPKVLTGKRDSCGNRSYGFWRVFIMTLKRDQITGHRLSLKRIRRNGNSETEK